MISVGGPPYSLLLMVLLPLTGRKVILCADSIADTSQSKLLRCIKHHIYKMASFVMVPGEAGTRFFNEVYGFQRAACLVGGYAMDVENMRKHVQSLDQVAKDQFLRGYGLPLNRKIFMMCANMLKRRDYPVLVEAFKRFMAGKEDVHLLMIGGGEDASQVDRMIAEVPEITRIDHCPYDELICFYSAIFSYVHTGNEPYSTAMTMGAIVGVPLISSLAVGASYDYIRDGDTGVLVCDPKNEDHWVKALNEVYSWGDGKRQAARDHLAELTCILSPEMTVPAFVKKLIRT